MQTFALFQIFTTFASSQSKPKGYLKVNALSIFQLLSCVAYLLLIFMLLLCPYSGEEFRNYRQARRTFIWAMLTLALQFVTQMVFHFREKDPIYGAACNMFFIFVVAQFCNMTFFRIMRVKSTCRREWTLTTAASTLNALIILIAAHAFSIENLRYAVWGSMGFYIIYNVYLLILLLREYRRVHDQLQQYYSVPIEEHTLWMRVYLMMRIIICIGILTTLFNNLASIVFAFVSYFCFVYFVARFMYYGHYIKSVEIVEQIIEEEDEETTSAQAPVVTAEPTEKMLQSGIQLWILRRGYCNPDITLDTLASELGTRRRTLSEYIRDVEHTTFRDWLNRHRIDYAKQLIQQQPDTSMEEISLLTGFSSRSYFDVIFKEKEGITPVMWRRNEN